MDETSKGYWSESSGYLDFVLAETSTPEFTRLSLSSPHWYRVQNFTIYASQSDCWARIHTILRECGRILPNPSETFVYRLGNLSAQQVNQIYYLLKHSLTSAKKEFVITHGISLNTSGALSAPKSKCQQRRLLKRKKKNGEVVLEADSKGYQGEFQVLSMPAKK